MLDSVKELVSDEKSFRAQYAEHHKLLVDRAVACQVQLEKSHALKCRGLNIKPTKTAAGELDLAWKGAVRVLNPEIKGTIGYFSNYLEDRLGEDSLKKYKGMRGPTKYGNVGYYEALNYIDGCNTVADIY